jgi:hypothetical protein
MAQSHGVSLKPAASGHQWMRIGIAILFNRAVETLKILFNEQLQARRGRCLDAHLVALGPLHHYMRRDCYAYGLSVESASTELV